MDVVRSARLFRARLVARDDQALAAIAHSYKAISDWLDRRILTLTRDITSHGGRVPVSWLVEHDRLNRLRTDLRREVGGLLPGFQQVIQAHQQTAATLAATDARTLMAGAVTVAPPARLTMMRTTHAVGVTRSTAFQSLLAELPDLAAERVTRALERGVMLGENPMVIAQNMHTALGLSRGRAQTIARTEALRAYRETSRAVWDEAGVEWWQWFSTLDKTACPVCVGMHGTLHPIDTEMGTHPSCRCTMIPAPDPARPPITRTGPEVFEEDWTWTEQRRLLGPGKHDAYLTGRLRLTDLIEARRDPRWGLVRRERSLTHALAATHGRPLLTPPTPRVPGTRLGRVHEAWPPMTRTTPGELRRLHRALEQLEDTGIDPAGVVPTPVGFARLDDRTLGAFYPGSRTIRVTTRRRLDMLDTATIIHHEVGHSIDQHTPGRRRYKSEGAPGAWRAFTRTANESLLTRYHRALRDETRLALRRGGLTPTQRGDLKKQLDHLNYLLQPREMWARAFAQYVAEATSPAISRRLQAAGGREGPIHWGPREWPTVRAAVQAVLESEGLVKGGSQ